MQKIRVENRYLSHILFNSNNKDLKELFEYTPGHVYTNSNELTSLLVLHGLICISFDERIPVTYFFNKEKVRKIFEKKEFLNAIPDMVNEIKRLYGETQLFIQNLDNNSMDNTITLYRKLSSYQINEFFSKEKKQANTLKTNYLTSFFTSNSWAKGLVTIECPIPKKYVLFYDNLIPFDYDDELSGLAAEGEAIIRTPSLKLYFKNSIIDYEAKKLVDMENEYFDNRL